MAIARPIRLPKRQFGLYSKMTAVTVLGLCFVFVWSFFSSSSSTSVSARRDSFDDIAEPSSGHSRAANFAAKPRTDSYNNNKELGNNDDQKKRKLDFDSHRDERKKAKLGSEHGKVAVGKRKEKEKEMKKSEESEKQEEEEGLVVDGKEEEEEKEVSGGGDDVEGEEGSEESETQEGEEDESEEKSETRKGKIKGPVFDLKEKYEWRLCSAKSKHNYIPCIDFETGSGKRAQSYRHTERSCPRSSLMCLVPLPRDGYEPPVLWPDSKEKILYKNVGHPKLAAFVKKRSWVVESGEYLTFPRNGSEVKGGVLHYLDSIAETVPDIEWGKNIRVVLDIGCKDSSFGASLLEKDVSTLTLGLKDDLIDLAQVALERGFPAIVSPLVRRRLPFPSGAFDAVHCAGCNVNWHSNGGIRLLEMNRILRPNGYFILSTKHDNIEDDEAMTELTASLCWNILAHKTDDISEVGVRIYQKPDSNDIYELRRKKVPAICKENETPDAAWYVPMKSCLHPIPTSIEEHGAEWPEEWPQRLETFPDWFGDKDKVSADAKHWSAIAEKSYLTGMGIDWSKIRNVMDMKAIYGGFAAALSKEKVWVMNVVPVHAPDTLPVIFERGLIGTYHDWCEPFGTYPRSYDLLHADHLFSRLKNRCKKAVTIVVEMDRITRPGGWAIVRDKVEILDALEAIFKSLRWDIRMTFAKNKEGIICAQKTTWRP